MNQTDSTAKDFSIVYDDFVYSGAELAREGAQKIINLRDSEIRYAKNGQRAVAASFILGAIGMVSTLLPGKQEPSMQDHLVRAVSAIVLLMGIRKGNDVTHAMQNVRHLDQGVVWLTGDARDAALGYETIYELQQRGCWPANDKPHEPRPS